MRFLLLGERAVIEADGSRTAATLRAVSLVGYLAAHEGLPQARSGLAAALWPDTAPDQASTNLRRELHHLRRLLAGDDSLVVSPSDLTWVDRGTCPVDLLELRRAAAALADVEEQAWPAGAREEEVARQGRDLLATYRGPFLPELDQDWAADLRDTVEQEVVDACAGLVRAALRSGTTSPVHGPALEAARRRIRVRPLEESGHAALVRLLQARGDAPQALAAYHRCARLLRAELGVEPAPETRALLGELLAGPSDGPRRAPRPTSVATRTGRRPDELVGRGPELQALLGQLDLAVAKGMRVVILHGEAGSGKSRLVEEVVDLARRRGLRAAIGRGHAMAGSVALAPVVDWLGDEVLAPAAGTDSKASDDRGEDPDHGDRVRSWDRLVFLRELVRRLAGDGPGVLVLEDVQWVDEDTLDLVGSLVRWEPDAPLLLLLTARSGAVEESTGLSRWMTGVRPQVPTLTLRTGPLPLRDGTTLLRRHGDPGWDDAQCASLHTATGGFPLHLVEAARLVARHTAGHPDPGTELPMGDLRGVLTRRLTALTGPAQTLAGIASAVGRSVSLPLLSLAGDLDDATTARAVDELCRASILVERGGGYDFTHDLMRDAAYEIEPPSRRALVHLRVGEALEQLHGGHLQDIASLLGAQYSRAGMPERAVRHLRVAAGAAQRVFAADRCIDLLQAAVGQLRSLPPGPGRDAEELECLHDLGAALNARHGWTAPALRSTLERAHRLAEQLHDDVELADVLTSLWGTDYVRGANRDALTAAQAAQSAALRTGDRARAAVGQFAVGATMLHLGRPREGLVELEQAMTVDMSAIRLAIGSRPEVHARAWAAHAHALLGAPDRALALTDEALERAGTHPYDRALALAYAAVTAHILGDRERLTALAENLDRQCERYEIGYYGSWGEALLGWLIGGPEGVRRIRDAVAQLRAKGVGARIGYFLSLLADVVDDPLEARAVLDAAAASAHAQEDLWWLPEIERQRALLLRPADQIAALQRALELAEGQPSQALADRCRQSIATVSRD